MTLQYPELERLARCRRVGVGSSDFQSYIGNADFAAKWNDIQSQLSAEGNGAGSLAVLAAQNAFASTFDNISSQLGVDPATALEASKQFILAGHTIAGAVHTVQQIQSAASGGDPSAAFNILTGALVAAATTSGVVTAGVGALITIGVGLGLSALSSLGLFGSQPQGTEWCSGLRTTGKIGIQIGCVATFGDTNQIAYPNGSPYWRRFPKPSGGNTNDDYWYNAKGVSGGFNTVEWSGNPNGPKTYWMSYPNTRLIDNAFGDWHYIACQTVPKGLEAFSQAFTQAWVSNQEYALNGLKVQPDWQVLRTLIGIWNRAHDGSSYVDIANAAKPSIREPVFSDISNPAKPVFDTMWGPTCPPNLPALFLTLVDGVIGHATTGDPIFASFYNASTNTLRIHTGPAITVKKVIPLVLGVKASDAAAAATPFGQLVSSFQSLSLPAKVGVVAGGAVAATAAGGSIYALATHQTIGGFWGGVWKGTQQTGKDAALAALGVFEQAGKLLSLGGKKRK